jgi:hypothetical protein
MVGVRVGVAVHSGVGVRVAVGVKLAVAVRDGVRVGGTGVGVWTAKLQAASDRLKASTAAIRFGVERLNIGLSFQHDEFTVC